MQVLTISDEVVPAIYSLNVKQRFSDVQFVLSCGDLPFYYLEFVVTMLGVPVFYIYGNHDGGELQNDGQVLHEARGGICLEGRTVEHRGLILGGLGGSIRYKEEGHHQYTEAQMMRRIWRMIPQLMLNKLRYGRYLDVLLTHAPPLGIHNGPDYPHRGFQAFLWFMERFQPSYLIHGHIHLSYGFSSSVISQHGPTCVINTAGHRLMDLPAPASQRLQA
jgi:Icc-related predicted phosphoesterase